MNLHTIKTPILRALLIIFIITTIFFIWSNSMEDSTESSERSGKIAEMLQNIIDPQKNISFSILNHIVRKTAHFSEYALLGAEASVLALTFERARQSRYCIFFCVAGFGFIIAFIDELIQLGSPGRSCQFSDMMIDTAGASFGSLLIILAFFIFKRIRASQVPLK